MKPDMPPPLHTALSDLLAWSFQRTATIPKSHRFTVGQRIDNLTLDSLLLVTKARWAQPQGKASHLDDINLHLDLLRVLWRIVHDSRWISQQQLLHVTQRLDEAGRMTGGWLRQVRSRTSSPAPPR